MADIDFDNLTGAQKAAILLIAIGSAASSAVFKELDEKEIEAISVEIAKVKNVPPEIKDSVIEEFQQMVLAKEYISSGGIDYARQILEDALGPNRALEILSRVQSLVHKGGFDLLKNVDPKQLLTFLQHEQPQTIALILANLHPAQAASIIADLSQDLQGDVIARLATLQQTPPDVIREIEGVIESQLSSAFSETYQEVGGVKAAAEIINRVGRTSEKSILEWIQKEDPDLAVEIKNLMFVFDDIIMLPDKAIQQVMKEVDQNDLALALKASTEEVKQKVFKNMSDRAAGMLKEDMDFMGPVKLRDVEEAQQKIVGVIRKLEEEGSVQISRGGSEDRLVE